MVKWNFLFEDKLYMFMLIFSFSLFISNAVANVAMVISFVLSAIHFYRNRIDIIKRFKQIYAPEGVKYFLYGPGIFFMAILLSALASDNIAQGLLKWVEKWPLRYLCFLVPLLCLNDVKKVKGVFYALLLGHLVSCLYLIGNSLVLGKIHIHGLYGHIMMNAGFICLLLPVLLIMCFYKKKAQFPLKYVFVLLALTIGALICTGIRGAWLACGVSLGIVILFNLRKNLKFALLFIICFSLLGLSLSYNRTVINRMTSITNISTDASITSRIHMWRSAIAMYKDNPLLGVGEGQYKVNMEKKYRTPEQTQVYSHAHSIIFHILCVDGMLGLVSMLLMFGSILYISLKNYFLLDNPWSLAIGMSTISLFLQGLTEYNIGQSSIMKLYWLLLGLMFVLAHYYNLDQNRGANCDE